MDKEETDLDNYHLSRLEVMSTNFTSLNTNRPAHLSRSLMKTYLNKSILQQCLITFDIFKEIVQDPLQKVKLIRDVIKNVEVKIFDEDSIIYNKGQQAQQIYLVLKGAVALCMPIIIENEELSPNDDRVEYEYQEIDLFEGGQGFGQAEFIHKRKRGLVAKAKEASTVVGKIHSDAFEEIIELYKQRIYYRKMDLFGKCSLLSNLKAYQLEFIVNNAKPVTFHISKEIVCEGEMPKALYLIMEGRVELRRHEKNQQGKATKLRRNLSKNKLELSELNESKIKLKNVIIGSLDSGSFLGLCQIALRQAYSFTAICTSEKVKAYVCDLRIIESQMNKESFQIAAKYERMKKEYREKKVDKYRDVKDQLQKDIGLCQTVILSDNQKQIKRQILNRYFEKKPTLIDKMSPQQIGKSVGRKYDRIKTLEPLKEMSYFGSDINFLGNADSPIKSPVKKLIRNQRALSPLLVKKKQKYPRKYSEPAQLMEQSYLRQSQPVYSRLELQDSSLPSQTKPTIAFIRPFHRKVETLHERLTKQYNIIKANKQKQLNRRKRKPKTNEWAEGSVHRLQQFISKLQKKNSS